ncbi:hypothetical protein LguiB_003748 [Lonicera macranthoides]
MEVEAVVEKIWYLHDKLSDAIHSISRTHSLLLNLNSDENNKPFPDHQRNPRHVFSRVEEAISLNAIRTALENLEDSLQVFHTVQRQQCAEREAAFAHLEQSRIVLAMRLAEHQGNNYTVIEEARAFAGDTHDAGCFAASAAENFVQHQGCRSNFLVKVVSSFNFAKRSLKVDGILGNAALVALSMLTFLHLVAVKDKYILAFPQRKDDYVNTREVTKVSRPESSSPGDGPILLDVLLARG